VRTYGDSSTVDNSYSQYHVTALGNLFTHVPPLLPNCILGSAKSVVVVPDQLAVYTYNSLYDRLNGHTVRTCTVLLTAASHSPLPAGFPSIAGIKQCCDPLVRLSVCPVPLAQNGAL